MSPTHSPALKAARRRVAALAAAASLAVVGLVALPVPTAFAQVEPAPTLPMNFAGDGCVFVIRAIDANTGTVGGTISLPGGGPMPFALQIQFDQFGNQFGMGQAQTPAGPRPLRVVDESDTVAQVTFEGRTYRVSNNVPAPAPMPPAPPVPAPAPAPEAVAEAPAEPFGVGCKPSETMPGWVVTEVDAGGAADKAGLKKGDVILGTKDADGKPVPIAADAGFAPLKAVLGKRKFTLTVFRADATPPMMEIKVEREAPKPATKPADAVERA